MSQSAVVHARLDMATKKGAEKILNAIGITPTEAIRLFYRQIAMRNEFPLELRVPNQITVDVLDKSDRNEDLETFESTDALYASWEK